MFDPSPPWLVGLNPEQCRAAVHGRSPLLILAGAGTGKTATLAARVAHLLAEGAAPDRICLRTFRRRRSQERSDRAGRRAGVPGATHVWGEASHAVGNQLRVMHGPSLGL